MQIWLDSLQHMFGINHVSTFAPAEVGAHKCVENDSEVRLSEKRSRCLCSRAYWRKLVLVIVPSEVPGSICEPKMALRQ